MALHRCIFLPPLRAVGRFRLLSTTCTRRSSLWDKAKDFILASEKETFHSELVQRAHRWDGLKEAEWTLIYRDQMASRTFVIMSFCIPIALLGTAFILYDITMSAASDRTELATKLMKDAKQLGYAAVLPALSLLGVAALLLRVHSLRVLRIYQKRQQPDSFIAIVPRSVLAQRQMLFSRDDAAACYLAEDMPDMHRIGLLFIFGNVQIGRRRLAVDDDAFRGNNFKTYMLNETSVPPRL